MNCEGVLGTALMTLEEPIQRVLEALDQLHIPYMLTGSFVSNYYGEPRSTHDIDLVVQMSTEHAEKLEAALTPDFVVSDARAAAAAHQSFNAIHVASSFKADFWPLKDALFDQEAFARRRPVTLFGRQVPIPTAEDLVLQKLHWAHETGSEQQRRDIVAVLRAQEALDQEYLRRWADTLGVHEELSRLQQQVKDV